MLLLRPSARPFGDLLLVNGARADLPRELKVWGLQMPGFASRNLAVERAMGGACLHFE